MRLLSGVPLFVLMFAGVGCDGMEASHSPPGPQVLVRRDPVPAGATCKYGGAALRTGIDGNRNGMLDDVEITGTTYVCDPSTTPVIRRDPVLASVDCPAGGIDIRAGIDDNGNGVLDDAEIEQTTRVCNSLELWDGDFTADSWSDPIKVAALEGARVVTGSLHIASLTPVRLPLLELVGGRLVAVGPTPSVALPALRRVGGTFELDLLDVDGSLAALERVDGSLALSSPGGSASGASVVAPKLAGVGGDLVIAPTARGEVSLPALRTVGGNLFAGGKLTTLRLDALTTIAGMLFPDDEGVGDFSLPALTTIASDLRVGPGIRTLSLPQLAQLGGRFEVTQIFGPTLQLTEVRLPALTRIGGNLLIQQARKLTALELGSLETVGGTFMINEAPALVTLQASRLRVVTGVEPFTGGVTIWTTGLETVDLGALTDAPGGVWTSSNPALREVRLSSLTRAPSLTFADPGDPRSPSVLKTVSAPNITALEQLVITSNHTLDTADFRRLTAITSSMLLARTSLPDLSGFSSLTSVRWLTIDGDDQLRDLRGLSSVQQLSFLILDNNTALTSVDGLEQIHEMSGMLELRSNPALTSTAGLRNVTSIGGTLNVQILPALTTLDLSSLQTVTGSLRLFSLPQVTRLDGLRALTSVGDNLIISSLTSLTSLAGLDALTSVGHFVNVQDLPNVPEAEILAFLRRIRGG